MQWYHVEQECEFYDVYKWNDIMFIGLLLLVFHIIIIIIIIIITVVIIIIIIFIVNIYYTANPELRFSCRAKY